MRDTLCVGVCSCEEPATVKLLRPRDGAGEGQMPESAAWIEASSCDGSDSLRRPQKVSKSKRFPIKIFVLDIDGFPSCTEKNFTHDHVY